MGKRESNILLRTNILVSGLLIIGFIVTAALGYQANYQVSVENIEQVSTLTSDGTFYQLQSIFSKPVNISLTMAHDNLLIGYLADEEKHLNDRGYVTIIQNYLDKYRTKYAYESVFLVSASTKRYYSYQGVDRILTEDDPENDWYYEMLNNDGEYSLNVDNDQIKGADNAVTVFVNCKIIDNDGNLLGIVGVGQRIDSLQQLLADYEVKFGSRPYLIDQTGKIQISASHTGYEKTDWFQLFGNEDIKPDILNWLETEKSKSFWTTSTGPHAGKNYVVTRYIPELSWHLVVVRDTSDILHKMQLRLFFILFFVSIVIAVILFVITRVIRNFNRRITLLMEGQQMLFRNTTEELYENIYEWNITGNRIEDSSTKRYIESLGVPENTSYNEALHVIAEKQIKEEFRAGYLKTFCSDNVLKEYEGGNTKLQYDFMIIQDNINYFWMRIDARIIKYPEDNSIRMYTYRKNIHAEKQKELQIQKEARTDQMTGVYTKKATEQMIQDILADKPNDLYCFYIFDIDDFKQVNDKYGHAFGDDVIIKFAEIIQNHFRINDIVGRIGGDEFAAFTKVSSREQAEERIRTIHAALDTVYTKNELSWYITASIGVSLMPADGTDFQELYEKADSALYTIKNNGKNNYFFYQN